MTNVIKVETSQMQEVGPRQHEVWLRNADYRGICEALRLGFVYSDVGMVLRIDASRHPSHKAYSIAEILRKAIC
jgi:hypothetical protein